MHRSAASRARLLALRRQRCRRGCLSRPSAATARFGAVSAVFAGPSSVETGRPAALEPAGEDGDGTGEVQRALPAPARQPICCRQAPGDRGRVIAGREPAHRCGRFASTALAQGSRARLGLGTTPVVPAVLSSGLDEAGSRDGSADALVAGLEVTAGTPGPSAGSRLMPIANRRNAIATIPSQRRPNGCTGGAAIDIVESVATMSG